MYFYLFGDNTYNKKTPPALNDTNLNLTMEIELEIMGVMTVSQEDATVTFKSVIR